MTFDLDDTLYENTSVIQKASSALTQFMHAKYPDTINLKKDYWIKLQQQILAHSPILKSDMSKLRQQTLELGFHNLGYSQSEIKNAADKCFNYFYFQRSHFTVSENVHTVLSALSNKIPLVAITNGNVDLKRIGIEAYFKQSYRASVDLLMKPNPAMFNEAQAYLRLPTNNILHIGDNLHKDVFGALKAGYQTAWYADDRTMLLNQERTLCLPHLQLSQLNQLLDLVF